MSATLSVDVDLWYEQQSAALRCESQREACRVHFGSPGFLSRMPSPQLALADVALACSLGHDRPARWGGALHFSKTADIRWRQ